MQPLTQARAVGAGSGRPRPATPPRRPLGPAGSARADRPPATTPPLQTPQAPWARGGAGGDDSLSNRPPGIHTGRPVPPLIPARPAMPDVLPPLDASAPDPPPAAPRIRSRLDLDGFVGSHAARSFVAFVLSINEACKGMSGPPSDPPCPPGLASLTAHLNRLEQGLSDFPPDPHPARYGNPSFRRWHAWMAEGAVDAVRQALEAEPGAAAAGAGRWATELAVYLRSSFGDPQRIDYGTGHELNFVALLYGLARCGALGGSDSRAWAALGCFRSYLRVARAVQTAFWLEPAGSRGVWGLDDHQHLPFLWGSAQLVDHPSIRVADSMNPDVVRGHADASLYLEAVAHVLTVKKGPLHATSPVLHDVSGVSTWSKVNQARVGGLERSWSGPPGRPRCTRPLLALPRPCPLLLPRPSPRLQPPGHGKDVDG